MELKKRPSCQRFVFVVFELVIVAVMFYSNAGGEEIPQVFAQLGHSGVVKYVTFSPDGRYALSGSYDKTMKLWDVGTGMEIRTFQGHSGGVSSVSFSPDGRYALSGSDDKTLKLWDVATGKEIRTFRGHSHYVHSVSFSPNGRYALSGSWDKTLKLWDVATGEEIRTFRGHSHYVHSVSFSPDGRYALSGSYRALKLWDVGTGMEIRTFQGHSDWVSSVSFSPDGRYALSGSDDRTLKLWDVGTGKEIRTYKGHSDNVLSVSFSPDGRYALSGSYGGHGYILKLWDVGTGKEIRTFRGQSYWVGSVSFSPDGRYALSGGGDNLKLWDVGTGKEIRTYKGHSDNVLSVSFSPDGRYALSGGGDKTLKLWDVATGKQIWALKGCHSSLIDSVSFSPDGRYALSGSYDKTLKLWDVATGKEIRTFKGHSALGGSVSFSPDGQYVLANGNDLTLKLWDAGTGKEIRTFKIPVGSHCSVFSPDGRYALSDSLGNGLKLCDVGTGKEIRTFERHLGDVHSVSFSPNGRYALSGSWDKTLKLWDVGTGEEIRTFKGHSHYVHSVSFSPDGRYALSGSWDKTLKLWDVGTGMEIRTFQGHSDWVSSVSFSPDGRYALSGSYDGTIRLWNIATGAEVAQMVGFTDDEWITITPEGYYNASVNGAKYLNVRVGNNVYDIGQYESIYYRPDIVELALNLGDTQQAIAQALKGAKPSQIAEVQPPKVWFVSPADRFETDKESIEVQVRTEDVADTAESVTFKQNLRPISTEKGKPVRPLSGDAKVKEFSKQIPLIVGENWISVEARGTRGAIQTSTILVIRKGEKKKLPVLWYLGVGVSNHSISGLSLNYAAKDVAGLAEVLQKQKGRVYSDVKTKLLTNDEATRSNVIDAIESFFKDASREDVAILFVSGHGMNGSSTEYHFVAYDTNPDKLSSTGVSWRVFDAALKSIKSTALLLADTCHSGNIIGNETWKAQANVDPNAFIRESFRGGGVMVFSSSSTESVSREDAAWGHGAFAKALIDGLTGAAAFPEDLVTLGSFQTYVHSTVKKLTDNVQQPVIPRLDGQGAGGALLNLVLAKKQ